MTKLFILFLVFSQSVFGQTNSSYNINVEIANVKAYVILINKDTYLIQGKVVRNDTKIPADTLFYEKNGLVQKITLAPKISSKISLPVASTFTEEYYFKDEKLVCFYRNGFNASRMGACGLIDIKTSIFFHKGTLIGVEVQKNPEFENCYPLQLDEYKIASQAYHLLRYYKKKNNPQ